MGATIAFVVSVLPLLVIAVGTSGGLRVLAALAIVGDVLVVGVVAQRSIHANAAREQLRREAWEANDRLFQIIDNTSAVIYLRDCGGRYILVNRQYEELFGVRRADLIGLTDHDLFPTEMADGFRRNDLRALASGTGIQMEELAPHPDGTHTYVTIKYPITGPSGQPAAVCGISTDITDLKRAEEQIRQLNAELEQRVRERTWELEASTRELDAFAYSVSHDLRAPLRALDGFSQVLIEDYGDVLDATGRDYLGRIQAATSRMSQLIDDLLDLSRATRVELRRQPVDLGRIASLVLDELRAEDPDRDVAVTVVDPLIAAGDPHLLRIIMQNLLGNAWKFTGKRTDGHIVVAATGPAQAPVFSVRDNGAGFDQRYADKLFVPFQRLHCATDFGGTGVGLAIVARIVHRHGGRIWAEGQPGHGATFFFTLTPDPDESEPSEAPDE